MVDSRIAGQGTFGKVNNVGVKSMGLPQLLVNPFGISDHICRDGKLTGRQ